MLLSVGTLENFQRYYTPDLANTPATILLYWCQNQPLYPLGLYGDVLKWWYPTALLSILRNNHLGHPCRHPGPYLETSPDSGNQDKLKSRLWVRPKNICSGGNWICHCPHGICTRRIVLGFSFNFRSFELHLCILQSV